MAGAGDFRIQAGTDPPAERGHRQGVGSGSRPKKQWTWVKGTGAIDQANLQSLLNTLSGLHAVRWIGANPPPHGFEKPQVTISFTTSPDDKTMHKLTVGGPAGKGMWLARVDGREGVFVISNPDFNALRLPLVQPPPATPAPSASPAASR